MQVYPDDLLDRFWSKVDKNGGPDACWNWLRGKTNGYGRFNIGGKIFLSHRLAYVLSGTNIPAGMFVLHSCDNPGCVNPDHLRLGSPEENIRDAIRRKRFKYHPENLRRRTPGYHRIPPRGSWNRQGDPLNPGVVSISIRQGKERIRKDALNRFLCRIDKSDGTGCWIWTGRVQREYGVFFAYGKAFRAHRYSYMELVGRIPDGLMILHSCDRPLCVNPEHLRPGTNADNMRDCVERGRINRSGARNPRRGEGVNTAKVTESQVREIRRKRESGSLLKDLSAEYGIAVANISMICLRKHWKHVD